MNRLFQKQANTSYASNLSIDQLIGVNYIRYDKLIEIVNNVFVGSDATEINIYIDIYSIIKPLYNDSVYHIDDYTKVTSNIINICAHYREFFKTRYGVYTKIFLVNSFNTPSTNTMNYPEYNSKFKEKLRVNPLIHDMINHNIGLMRILCPYLPEIHLIESAYESSVVIYDTICKNELVNNSPNIIITKDIYVSQLVAIKDNTFIFRPKKNKGMDMSYPITKSNLIQTYLQSRKAKEEFKYTTLNPGLIPIIMGLSSVSERNIKTLANIRTSMNLIYDAVMDYKLINGYNNISNIWDNIDNSKLKGISRINLEYRMRVIDIPYQHSLFMNTPEQTVIHKTNMYDPETIKEINNKYFIKNPLDLDRL